MKEKRGKAVETNDFLPPEYSSPDLNPCKRHPSSSSSVGICAYCLKERLIKLVCSDCGEQRLSSCSCSDFSSSHRNSSATEIGSVGRISFLLENERIETKNSKSQTGVKSEDGFLLRRSSSSCVGGVTGVKRRSGGGIWRIVRLFRKKREKGGGCSERRSVDEKTEMWVFDYMGGGGVSRSRSLCSFRGGSFHEEVSSDFAVSTAKVSDFTGNSGVDSERPSGFSESALNGTKRSVFPVKESDFSLMDDSGFIDLKLDLETESRKAEYSVLKSTDFPVPIADSGSLRSWGSCRITGNEMEMKKGRRGYKVWRWIFRHRPHWRSAINKDEIHVLKT